MTIQHALLASLLLVLLLSGCAPASSPTPREPAPISDAAVSPAEPVMPKPGARGPDDIASATQVDYACQSDADCAVKNIGNCCGYYPACVNVDSRTFPEQVKQRCDAEGMSSICGFAEISACRCVEQRCAAAPGAGAGLKLD